MQKQPQRTATAPKGQENPAILRDQQRALHAYRAVGAVPLKAREDYKIAVNNLAANLVRLKLAGALAALERRGDEGANLLLDHLGSVGIPGLQGTDRASLPDRARGLLLDNYILATREMLRVAEWLKRAVQATF